MFPKDITRELGLNNNLSTKTYSNTSGFFYINDNKIRDLRIKCGTDNISIENHRLPNMCSIPKMYKNPIKARFIIGSTKGSVYLKSTIVVQIPQGFSKVFETISKSQHRRLQSKSKRYWKSKIVVFFSMFHIRELQHKSDSLLYI